MDTSHISVPSIDPDALAAASPEVQRAALLDLCSSLFAMPDSVSDAPSRPLTETPR